MLILSKINFTFYLMINILTLISRSELQLKEIYQSGISCTLYIQNVPPPNKLHKTASTLKEFTYLNCILVNKFSKGNTALKIKSVCKL